MPLVRHARRIYACMGTDSNVFEDSDDEDAGVSRLLTPGQVADLTGVPTSTLARWRCQRRELAFVRLGRAVRYRPQDVNAWIAKHVVEPCS